MNGLKKAKREKELFEEISGLKNKLSEVEGQLKEAKKVNNRLLVDTDKRKQTLNDLDVAYNDNMESFRWRREQISSNMHTKIDLYDYTLRGMRSEESELSQIISGYDTLMIENIQLEKRYKELTQEYFLLASEQDTEHEQKKQENFDLNLKLDLILRSTLEKFDGDYLRRANSDMEKEAEIALLENVRLCTEFDLREEKCENLVRQQQQSFDTYTKLHLEKEVVDATTSTQEDNINEMQMDVKKKEEAINILHRTCELKLRDLNYFTQTEEIRNKLSNDATFSSNELYRLKQYYTDLELSVLSLCDRIVTEGLNIMVKSRNSDSKNEAEDAGIISNDEPHFAIENKYSKFYDTVNSTNNSKESPVRNLSEVWHQSHNNYPLMSDNIMKFLKKQRKQQLKYQGLSA